MLRLRYLSPKDVRIILTVLATGSLLWVARESIAQQPAPQGGRNVNMVTADENTDFTNGDPFRQRQDEPSIAISTRNLQHYLGGANDYRTVDLPGVADAAVHRDSWLGLFKSVDGGNKWTSTLIPGYPQDTTPQGMASPLKGFGAGSDPAVRAAAGGLFYYLGIAFNRADDKQGVLFVSRIVDNNNKEAGDPFVYVDTNLVHKGNKKHFLDKPWMAVDIPRSKRDSCSIRVPNPDGTTSVQTFPGGNIYVSYADADPEDTDATRMMFVRSTNCGVSWEGPVRLSDPHTLNQGSVIAIDPNTGTVYVAWRQIHLDNVTRSAADAILVTRSLNNGIGFSKTVTVASPITPFDQPTFPQDLDCTSGPNCFRLFRTDAFPTMTVDANADANRPGRVYVAWSDKAPAGYGRIVLSVSQDGATSFSTPFPVDNTPGLAGSQMMPSILFATGKLMMIYYDFREDFRPPEEQLRDRVDPLRKVWHTVDVRAAQADPSNNPVFISSQISRYLYVLDKFKKPHQAQANPVNYPMFNQGRVPFIGDYIDVTAPLMVKDKNGQWKFNTERSSSPVFQAVWTDNRDVIPPKAPQDWTKYTPAGAPGGKQSVFNSKFAVEACVAGNAGMRNQNIYTSRVTQGLVVSSPGNSKPLGKIQRAFVIYVENTTNKTKYYRLGITEQPAGGSASFLQFAQRNFLDLTIAPRSSIARTVFVTSPNPHAAAKVDVVEIAAIGGLPLAGGLQSSIILNPDILNPDILNPDILNPDILNPDILNFEVYNPDISNTAERPDILNPDILNPDILNPDILNPDILNPDILNPDILNPDILNPDILNPDILNPDILNPDILNPDILNTDPEVVNADKSKVQINDLYWDISNKGNTTSAYAFRLTFPAKPKGFKFQLLIFRLTSSPAVNGCAPVQQQHEQLVANIINPDILNPDILNPDILNSDVRNASLFVAPGDSVRVQLRVFDLDKFDSNVIEIKRSRSKSAIRRMAAFEAQVLDLNLFDDVQIGGQPLTAAVVSQSVDTASAQAGITQPSASTTRLTVTTTVLPAGRVSESYSYQLLASGGTEPFTWTLAPSSALPAILSLSPSGLITGSPTSAGTFAFTVLVADSDQQLATRELSIAVAPPLGTPAVAFVTQPAICAIPETNCVRQGAPISPPVSMRALNAAGSPVSGVSVGISIGMNNGGGVLGGTLTAVTNSFGVAAFGDLTISLQGTYTLVAVAAGYTSATTSAFNVLPAVIITTASLPDGVGGNLYDITIASVGGVGAKTWSITSGGLQPNLSLDTNTGHISGTAGSAGTLNFTVNVSDSGVPQQSDSKTFSIRIADPLSIPTASLLDGTTGVNYSQQLLSSGGIPSVTWALAPSSSLPANLTLSSGGLISGTPVLAGDFTFTVVASDNGTPPQIASKMLNLHVAGVALTSTDMASPIQGSTQKVTLTGAGFVPGGTTVNFGGGGVQVLSTNVVSPTSLTATVVFSDVPGPRAITVATIGGTSNALPYVINSNGLSTSGLLSNVTHLAGSTGGPGSSNGTAPSTKFRQPYGIFGTAQNLYITDFLNHTIRSVSLTTGASTTLAGTVLGSGTINNTGTAARFFHPIGVWSDGTSLWIADSDNSLIRKITLDGAAVTTIAGSTSGFAEGTGTQAQFNSPRNIWGDGTDLFIADTGNHVIRRMNLTTNAVTTLAGTPQVPGSSDGVGTGASFNTPSGVWGDGLGNLFVTDTGNHTIRKIVISTGSVVTVAGMAGVPGSTSGPGGIATFNGPTGIWGDAANIYIADTNNHLIRTMLNGDFVVSTLAGSAGVSGDVDGTGGPGGTARFNFPLGVWLDGNGSVFVTDGFNHAIRKISISTGNVTTFSGQPARSGTSDGVADVARFFGPSDSWGDGAGNMYVVDRFNHLIRKVVLSTGQVTTVAGQTSSCVPPLDGVGPGAQFCDPVGIWGDGLNLYIADPGSRTIRKLVIATGQVTTIAGTAFSLGSADGPALTTARFNTPNGIWGDGGNLYITDLVANTIRKLSLSTGQVTTPFGLANSGGSTDAVGTASRFRRPAKLWGNGSELYVTDSNNHKIRKIVLATSQVSTLAGNGSCGSLNAVGILAQFCSPTGIWGDGSNLYVVSSGEIRQIALANANVTTMAGMFTVAGSDDANGIAPIFQAPEALWGDGNSLYINDVRNNAVRKLSSPPPVDADTVVYDFSAPQFGLVQSTPFSAIAPNIGSAAFRADFTANTSTYAITNNPPWATFSGQHLKSQCFCGQTLTITFNTPVYTAGVNFAGITPGFTMTLTTAAGSASSTSGASGGAVYFSSPTPFTSIQLGQGVFAIDNLILSTVPRSQ